SPTYYNRLFERLGELTAPDYLEELFAQYEPELRRYAQLLHEEGIDVPQTDVDAIKNQLYDQQVFLRELLRPMDGVNFDCRLMSKDPMEGRSTGTLEVEAWATTRVPVVLRGFRFGNDRFVTARQSIAKQNPMISRVDDDRDAVVLPNHGRRVVFRFPIDERLAGLRDIRAIKQAVRSGSEKDISVKLSLQAEYRYIGNQAERVEELTIRRFGAGWENEGGRPESPTLDDVLTRHAFLSHDSDRDVLTVRRGAWDVDGDLTVPHGFALHIGPGVTLRFDAGAAIIATNALLFEGTSGEPIVLGPKPGVSTWAGIVVIEAAARSVWRHVSVRDTDVVMRGGWVLTGGVTFYRSPVELYDCTISDARGEDALNIYDCDFLLERVTIQGAASDAFDGDFVTGIVRSCTFSRTVEDAVDVSGSDVEIIDSRFVDIGDKCVSAGENSTVRVRGGVVESASIAIASKDSSHVDIADMEVRHVENYVLAAYIKKPEYGPSSIIAANLTIGDAGRGLYLVQSPCKIELDGESIAGVEVDVKDLYDRKILGK
ncbi:MAG: hypothetical protein IH985_05715, partial [Planctomycetes bacterium]|nr:hypothetical protein [Planctomycetota bacterium]